MHYAVKNPVDGVSIYQPPTSMQSISSPEDAGPGDFVLTEEEASHGDWVWDSELETTRPPTEQELLQQDLDQARYDKQVEFAIAAFGDLVDLEADVVGDLTRIPPDLRDQATFASLLRILKGLQDPAELQPVGAISSKLISKRQYIQSRTLENSTPEQVRAETWQD